MDARLQRIMYSIDRVQGRYNPENDIIPGAPVVTWTDNELAETVLDLAGLVDLLLVAVKESQARITELEKSQKNQ